MTAQSLLLEWLKSRLKTESLGWLEEKAALLSTGAPDRIVYTAFSSALRYSGKDALALQPSDLKAARAAVPDWNPSDWTLDQAARIFLLLALPPDKKSALLMDQMFQTADVGEAVALEKALAVLGYPEGHMHRAREAIRSNIKSVFEAVTLRNPYASLHFDETGWNQMVVKTFFVDSPLREVAGLDRRVNPDLAQILVDLAFERWAAGRSFSPDLWRCVGPCANARGLEGLKKVLSQGSQIEKGAAALALNACPDPAGRKILDGEAELAAAVRAGKLTWENLYDGR